MKKVLETVDHLLHMDGEVTGASLATELGISRQAGHVWVKKLERLGHLQRNNDHVHTSYGRPHELPGDPSEFRPKFWRELMAAAGCLYYVSHSALQPRLTRRSHARQLCEAVAPARYIVLDFRTVEYVSMAWAEEMFRKSYAYLEIINARREVEFSFESARKLHGC